MDEIVVQGIGEMSPRWFLSREAANADEREGVC